MLAALQGTPFAQIRLCSGRYGLSSKDTTPGQIAAVYQNQDKTFFTVGIEDDVTHLSLPVCPNVSTIPKDIISCKFWGLGGDGTVSATKNSIKIIGNNTQMTAQGYFEYDSKKSRGLTISHLRFGKSPIRSTYLVQKADFVACHNPIFLHKYDMVQEVKDGGIFLLNCTTDWEECERFFPDSFKTYVAAHHIRLYLIDALAIGKEIGLNGKTSTILQAAFFAASGILPLEEARRLLKDAALQTYGKKGDNIIRMNNEAIDRGMDEVIEVSIPDAWQLPDKSAPGTEKPFLPDRPETLDYVKNIQRPVNRQHGNDLPVSAFLPYADGLTPPGTTAHERRNLTTETPLWKPENCIQCNLCSYVCPHAVIRPAVMTEEELAKAPEGMPHLPMTGMPEHSFAVTISQVDCTGCGSCAAVCPGKMGNKALEMCPVHELTERQQYFDYGKALPPKAEVISKFRENTVKGSQFKRPLMEFSGACAGCGETPYVKLLTQLFGDRMYIANATGCSTIWANSAPSTAYAVNECGCGPAWSNSLFEDGAEFGYGMLMAQEVRKTAGSNPEGGNPMDNNPAGKDQENATALQAQGTTKELDTIQWIIGGDGWAYDIGFGGLDHVLASGKNINILVLDTEVYSNTGGQASKATPTGSTAKFVTGGKATPKKDLAGMAMTYGNVYVAQIAMGADYAQTIKALTEAADYPGPSLVIAYCTCIAHGIRSGMGSTPHEEKKAVETGYFHLFRFNPALQNQGKNPFTLDSKEPKLDYEEFLDGEIRYDSLKKIHPDEAKELFEQAANQARQRYRILKKKVELYAPDDSAI